MNRCPLLLALFPFALANGPSAQAPSPAAVAPPRPVDLAICLDVSGSMDGLIDAARQHLWSVVNELGALQPTPKLRVALLTYGCTAYSAEAGWVRVDADFTTDLDTVSQKLFALTTNGGDEYVGRVLKTALQLEWCKDPGAMKLLWVAGNEAATQDPIVDFATQSRAALARGIVVNSIYCGNPDDGLAPAWRDVSKLAEGAFAAIDKDHAVVIPTPFDAKLVELSGTFNATYVAFGKERAHWAQNQVAQDCNAAGMNPAAAATRCLTKGSALYLNGHWDLVDACSDATFRLEDVKKDDLPEELRALDIAALRAHVAVQRLKREELKKAIDAIGKERDAFVENERKKLGDAAKSSFETVILEAVRKQAEARGFRRATKQEPETTPAVRDERFVALIETAAKEYVRFACVTGAPRHAPTDCRRAPPPNVRLSSAEKEHGGKLYLLFARHALNDEYVIPGKPAQVGQTLVKEAWHAVKGAPQGATAASSRYMGHLVLKEGNTVCHAGDAYGLFVMHKLAKGTEGTDDGWVYGTVDPEGHVTSAGKVASCIRCHQDATEDRRFGLR